MGTMMTFDDEITASHPTRLRTTEGYSADNLAMKLVGERHEKRELVNLVRWLILDKAKTAGKAQPPEGESSGGVTCYADELTEIANELQGL